jgi:hypothetical protein
MSGTVVLGNHPCSVIQSYQPDPKRPCSTDSSNSSDIPGCTHASFIRRGSPRWPIACLRGDRRKKRTATGSGSLSADFNLSSLFKSLFEASAKANLEGGLGQRDSASSEVIQILY